MSAGVARAALRHWGLQDAPLSLIAERENSVYRTIDAQGIPYALRLHRQGYQCEAALQSELDWMACLGAQGMSVPAPQPGKTGARLMCEQGIFVDLLSWLDGPPLGETGVPLDLPDRIGTFRRIGAAVARMHLISDDWSLPDGFERPAWDARGLVGEVPFWGRFWENPHLSADESALLIAARDHARERLASADHDYGLIHADLVRENILLGTEQIHLIDFDDSGFGYRLFDVATALYKNRSEPDYPALEQAFLDGYRNLRALDAAALPLFTALRSFTYLGWIIPRRREPGAMVRQNRFKTHALEHAKALLG